jgi:hypothetical protein
MYSRGTALSDQAAFLPKGNVLLPLTLMFVCVCVCACACAWACWPIMFVCAWARCPLMFVCACVGLFKHYLLHMNCQNLIRVLMKTTEVYRVRSKSLTLHCDSLKSALPLRNVPVWRRVGSWTDPRVGLCVVKKTPWSESASELYRSSDRRLSAKWLPTFEDRRCHVVSMTDPYGRILGFLDRSGYFSIK